MDFIKAPPMMIEALDVFEVRNGDAAGVAEDVRKDHDASFVEGFISFERKRTVGKFADELCLDVDDVVSSDDAFESGREEDIALEFEKFFIGDGLGAGITDDRTGHSLEFFNCLRIEAGRIIDTALGVTASAASDECKCDSVSSYGIPVD